MAHGTSRASNASSPRPNTISPRTSCIWCWRAPKAPDKTAPRVTIINHPDVRRSLMLNKAYAEGMRALVLYTAAAQDRIVIGEHAGIDVSLDEAINDLLLPIVKGAGSERSYDQLA